MNPNEPHRFLPLLLLVMAAGCLQGDPGRREGSAAAAGGKAQPGTVTWRGTMYDYAGSPVPGARIALTRLNASPWEDAAPETGGAIICDAGGRFERSGIAPGYYLAPVFIPDPPCHLVEGVLAFDAPGLVERDLHVTGGVIRGRVIDGSTGEPLKGGPESNEIWAEQNGADAWWKCLTRAQINGEGRFCLQGLAPAFLDLTATPLEYAPWRASHIEIREGQVVDDMEIVLEPVGYITVKLEALADPPAGEVRGRIVDASTGGPLTKIDNPIESPEWDDEPVFDELTAVIGLKGETYKFAECGARDGFAFVLGYVPAGSYRVEVSCPDNYFDYRSRTFVLTEGQKLDLGDIPLQPAGVLLLEVVDTSGNYLRDEHGRIRDTYLTCLQSGDFAHSLFPVDDRKGIFRQGGFPIGQQCRITVMVEGYQARDIDVMFEPGVPAESRVELARVR